MLRNSGPAVRAAASVFVLGVLAASVFVGVSLVVGGEGDPSPLVGIEPTPPPDLTPPPPWISPYPTQDPSLPTQPADDTDRTPDPNATAPGTPDSITISGVDIPIPEGWIYYYSSGPEARPQHQIWNGDSVVRFDQNGLVQKDILPSLQTELETVLDGLWILAQTVGTPSPPSLSIDGQDIPLPLGSYYSTFDTPLLLNNPVQYTVRFSHSLVIFDSTGLDYAAIASGDETKFESAVDALAAVSVQE